MLTTTWTKLTLCRAYGAKPKNEMGASFSPTLAGWANVYRAHGASTTLAALGCSNELFGWNLCRRRAFAKLGEEACACLQQFAALSRI